jgi:cytochrome c553
MIGVLVRSWTLIGLVVLATIVLMILLALIFMASGAYNVAASDRHLLITRELIAFTLRRSVETRSMFVQVPTQTEDDLVALGANHFNSACAPCHGSPAKRRNPIVLRMLPAPPPLGDVAEKWNPSQLFWIVKHGLKYTGMPAWPGERRDDEVWAVVAFLERLQDMEQAEYRRLIGAADQTGGGESSRFLFAERKEALLVFCGRCHGTDAAAPVSRRVPTLHGQSAGYLKRALEEYRDGKRSSGFMEPIAADLTLEQINSLADVYAQGRPISLPSVIRVRESLDRGRIIAERGIRESGIPPCLACHSGHASRQFPILSGLSAEYLSNQLSLWRQGLRNSTAYGAIMAVIANRLEEQQIRDVTAYLESLQDRQTSDRATAPGGGE